MPAEPAFLNDKLENLVRKCIVFPADGSETRIAHMVARTVTRDDLSWLKTYSRCVDLITTFGDEHRKLRVLPHRFQVGSAQDSEGIQNTYLFFFNMSPNLPINLNVTRLIGVTPSHLKAQKRLFWRGDVVAMKVLPESERFDFIVESLDADLFDLKSLEDFFREKYGNGGLEHLLQCDEDQWEWYCSDYRWSTSLLFGASTSYWGQNAVEEEENFLHDLNELRSSVGRPPIARHVYMKSYTALFSAFKSTFRLRQKITGPPKLPPELERRIFEMCALDSPETCIVLVLVAKRVYTWIDPILLATVCIMEDFESKRRNRLEHFLTKLTNRKKPVEYARHVKNLALLGIFFKTEEIDGILAACTGIENLVLLAPASGLKFFENLKTGQNLRRLTIKLQKFQFPIQFGSMPNFYHPCFANLTHLHLTDEDDDWPSYTGWENLISLTHIALACSGPPETILQLIHKLPTVRYVALGHYVGGERYKYVSASINNNPHVRAAWGERVVLLSEIPQHDWERGARGGGDFWDLVEEEVERRIQERSVH